ncbi:MAG: SRPBCC family protein [Actinobacteria bacterium]|nr:SRPBCC family protein [Actinomycetota bacterium]
MQLTHSFTVPAEIDQAWEVLLDIERIAPCMPGAALDTVDGDEFTGTVKVRLGPIGLTYRGKARWVSKDAGSHRAVIDAQGRDARGNGTAKATITATLTARGAETAVEVVTDLTITGKPAQFGRGVMADVGNKLIGQFADCLAGKLAEPEPAGGLAGSESAGESGGPAVASAPGAGSASGAGGGSGPAGDSGAGGASGPAGADRPGVTGTAEQEVAATLGGVEFDTAERLGIADEASASLPAGAGSAGPSAGSAGPSAGAAGQAAGADQSAGKGQALAEPGESGPSLAEPGLADTDVVEAGAAGLRNSTAATDAATAGAGRTGGAGTGEQVVEPAAASEAAPPAQRITETGPGGAPTRSSGPTPARRVTPAEVEPIDLLSSAGPALAKRLAPVAAALLVAIGWLVLRRRRG